MPIPFPTAPPAQAPLPERPHRNHGLFSDHYLDHTLSERADWRLFGASDEVIAARSRVEAILAAYSPSANEAQTEIGLIKPVLDALGHTVEVQASLVTPGTAKKPDYVFYRDQSALETNKGKRLTEELLAGRAFAVGDAKYWDRPLDVAKVSGDLLTNVNPASQIEFYMRYSGVPWGILTNGRLWRLYHKDSAKHLDRYYEVDLPALLADPDPGQFLYFYAFFSRHGFESWDLGVEMLLRGSNEYAREIGDSLKAQVFEALRHLAQGFLDYRPNQLQPDPATLKAVYDGSLIILYRLLFVLYAEARDLLPVHTNRHYRETYSLDAIKREIQRGRHLLAGSGLLWARLSALFEAINLGSPELDVPTYNGGLFDAVRHPFVAEHAVGDNHLQLAIDMLARVDGRFVDYRDLQVRHLGTIYEGLLEYHLQPIEPAEGWSVDLLNDRGERKTTGSYYTPDYIVAYMVDQTLRPLLEGAAATHQDDAARVEAVLAINVLDMAMGSAHFLVEVTEYMARFLVGLGVAPTEGQGEADLAYWKRRVAQACVYGVDLNPLAVDLAKLSLWLITVARDRPLSFLDHHLRAGNSLMGTRLAAITEGVDAIPRPKSRARVRTADPNQLALFAEEEFRQRMSTAVSSMWMIEGSSASTPAEVKQQETLYADLRRQLVGAYGTLANLLTVRRFEQSAEDMSLDLLVSYAMGRSLAAPAPIVRALEAANDLAARRRFFHWELEFPEVFFNRHGQSLGEATGFDVVIGNPPYIRQEGLTADKPFLQRAFPKVYHGTADLSIYFFAQALALLRPGGRTAFINADAWLRANYATPLRAFLRASVTVERLIDLGDNRVFADAPDVHPAIHVFSRAVPASDHTARTAVFGRGEGIADLARQVKEREIGSTMHDQLDSGWQLGAAPTRSLFTKIMACGRPLDEVIEGRMYYGVKTGRNEAFIVDQATRDQLVAVDPSCASVIKPFLRGEDLRPWYQEDERQWLLFIRRGVDIDAYPSIKRHLERYRTQLEPRPADYLGANWPGRKAGSYKWYELQDSVDYFPAFEKTKILWPDIAKLPRFSCDTSGYYLGNTGYIANTDQPWILAFLASRCAWFMISRLSTGLGERAGAINYRLFDQFMRRIAVPVPIPAEQAALSGLAELLGRLARDRYALHQKTRHRILTDLGLPSAKLNQKLTSWWDLDFPSFRAELRKTWKREIPLGERDDWEALLSTRRAEHQRLTARIVEAEMELNARVYALFGLTADEIRIIEESTTYNYGTV